MNQDVGYLQLGQGIRGPFQTYKVTVKNTRLDNWFAYFESRWRRVHIQVNRLYILYKGEKITILIEGV